MIRAIVFLAVASQMPLAAALAGTATGPTSRVPGSRCQSDNLAPASAIGASELANQTSESAPACGPMGLGGMEAAIRFAATTNVAWNETHACRSVWVKLDYLAVWVKGGHVPPPVPNSPTGSLPPQAGAVGQPGNTTLFGDQRLDAGMHSGGRITGGAWLIDDELGVEASYFTLGTETTHFSTDAAAGAR